jgi:large subunit ribosomal protein L6
MSTESESIHEIGLAEGVTASLKGRTLTVKGPLGTVNKRFDRIHVNMEVKDGKVRIKPVFAHFPVTVKVKGNTVNVENFVGERSARITKIVGDCKVTVDGDDIIIKGVSLEDVGQTSANLEQATKIKRKDQRIFLDGVYVYEKKKGW